MTILAPINQHKYGWSTVVYTLTFDFVCLFFFFKKHVVIRIPTCCSNVSVIDQSETDIHNAKVQIQTHHFFPQARTILHVLSQN